MWGYCDIKKILGLVAAIAGIVILIVSLPPWLWMLAMGGFLIWFGWILCNTK